MNTFQKLIAAFLILFASAASAGNVQATIFPGARLNLLYNDYECSQLSIGDLEFIITRYEPDQELNLIFLNPAGQCSWVANWDGTFQMRVFITAEILSQTAPDGRAMQASYKNGPIEYRVEELNLDFLKPNDDRTATINNWVEGLRDRGVFLGSVVGDGGRTNLDVLLTYSGTIFMGKYTGKFFFQAPFTEDLKKPNGEWKEGWENAPAIFSKILLEPFRESER